MRKEEVRAQVVAVAEALRELDEMQDLRGRSAWAMVVLGTIQSEPRHEALARHLQHHYKPDPYQHMKGWMPRWTEG